MFFLIYNLLSVFLAIPVVLYHLYRSVSRGRPPAFAERFGFLRKEDRAALLGRRVVWLHAVSVGEAIASRPLLRALKQQYPDHLILVTTTTETGRSTATAFPEKDLCLYFPFDFLPAVRRTLDAVRPDAVVIMETEIWPNFSREASARNIPVILANGRISDRSYGRYLKFSWFFRQPLQLFSALCMQTAIDRERIVAIGAPPGRTLAAGNLKYDMPLIHISDSVRGKIREQYRIPDDAMILVAGSTHEGEELILADVYRKLLAADGNLFMILAPRHPERTPAVTAVLERAGIPFRRRTGIDGSARFRCGEVLLVDTVGEMMSLYSVADIAFVGGSLVPAGGHNLLEPASRGVPCLFGPHMNNFREISGLVLGYGAGIQVEQAEKLEESFRSLIDSAELRLVLGRNGLKLIRDNSGSAARHLDVIGRYL